MYLYSIFPKVELSDCRVARKPLADVLFFLGGGGSMAESQRVLPPQ